MRIAFCRTAAVKKEAKKISFIIPFLIIIILISAFKNHIPAYNTFLTGAEEGLKTVISVIPPLIAVLSASAMMRESGIIDIITEFLKPITGKFAVPSEIIPLALIRPLSGGGSMGILTDTVKTYGADSRIAKAACILFASTETTFYTISVYFGRTKVKYTKKVIIAAVLGDLAGILCACALSRVNF